jgi:hypothetical protein
MTPHLPRFAPCAILLAALALPWLSRTPAETLPAPGQDEARRLAALVSLPEEDDGIIRLPVRFHLITDVAMEKRGVTMSTWITEDEVRDRVLPEVNRIWQPAGIEFVLEGVVVQPGADVPDRDGVLRAIARSKRSKPGTPQDPGNHPAILNVHLFPYLGQTFQGFADLGGTHAVLGLWTDKPSKGQDPPQKVLLVEEGPFRIGSLARTCAHELGHNLTLRHPPKDPESDLRQLMGGYRQGCQITPEEAAQARTAALSRAQSILKWAREANGKP